MAAPTIYRSTDTGAPVLTAQMGSIVNLLDKVLVNGYGSTRATGTITSNGTNVSNNDTVTVDGTVYTFKTALTPAANEVLIGASAAASLTNLVAAMCGFGTSGTTYGAGTTQQTNVQVTNLTATVITLQAFTGGTGGNSIAIAKSAATLTVSGATLSGGSGSDTTSSLGWGKPFSGTFKADYRAAAGVRQYLDVDDSGPDSTALGRNFRVRGYEAMTALATGTGAFPTTSQATQAVNVKSSTLTVAARPWIVIGDGYTFYMLVATTLTDPPNLGTNVWDGAWLFGEIQSVLVGDLYRSVCGAMSVTSNTTTAGISPISTDTVSTSTGNVFLWMPRGYGGLGTAIWAALYGHALQGHTYPNQADGGLYANAVLICERGNAATPGAANASGIRGYMRGFYNHIYAAASFNDQDTFTGIGTFAGINFIIPKQTAQSTGIALATTAWTLSS